MAQQQSHPTGNSGDPRQSDATTAQSGTTASWPTLPDPATGPLPLPAPTRRGYGNTGQRDWQRERDEQEEERERQRDVRQRQRERQREADQIAQHLRRLDAEEAAISAQMAALPSSSPITRLVVALAILAAIIGLGTFYPVFLVPLIVVLLIAVRAGRHSRGLARQRRAWANQERIRLQGRWNALVAERGALVAQLTALQSQPHP